MCNDNGFCECYKAGLIDKMTDAELDIKKLLDKHGIWVANNGGIVERAAFALELLERYSNQLSNLRLGLTTIEELTRDENTYTR